MRWEDIAAAAAAAAATGASGGVVPYPTMKALSGRLERNSRRQTWLQVKEEREEDEEEYRAQDVRGSFA